MRLIDRTMTAWLQELQREMAQMKRKKILIILSENTNEENRSRFAGDKKYQPHGCPESFDELIFPKDENKEHGHREGRSIRKAKKEPSNV